MSIAPTANDFKHIPGVNDAEYIELLKRALERQKHLTSKAIAKLKKQPEIITCGECARRKTMCDGRDRCAVFNVFVDFDGYCKWAERRTDE